MNCSSIVSFSAPREPTAKPALNSPRTIEADESRLPNEKLPPLRDSRQRNPDSDSYRRQSLPPRILVHHILFADGTVELFVGFPRTEEIIKIIINGEAPPKGMDRRFIEAFSASIRASPNLPINRGRNISNCIPHANPLGLQHLTLSIDDRNN